MRAAGPEGVPGAAADDPAGDETDWFGVLATETVPALEVLEPAGEGPAGVALPGGCDVDPPPACSALICVSVDEMDECNCEMPVFSRVISAATAAACVDLPAVVGGAVFTE